MSSSSSSSSSSLQPSDYAYQWCNSIIGEPGECKRGVDYVSANIGTLSPGQVIQNCTNSKSIDGFSTSDAFRYGCYLNAAFQGPVDNLCSAPFGESTSMSIPIPCAATCKTVYGGLLLSSSSSSSSSSGQLDVCTTSAQNQFNSSVQNGKCGDPTQMLSCIDGLFQSGSGFDCEQKSKDFENTCKPSVIGCVLGSLQSGSLYQIQKYQTHKGLPKTSCANFMYTNQQTNPPNQPNDINQPNQPNDPNKPDSNWNPWPDGPTY